MKQGWEIKKLGEVCETSSGGTPSKTHKEYYEGGNIPWLRSGEVSQGLIYDTELYITEEGLKNSSAKIFPIDTVVIAMYGATVGQVGILKRAMSTNQAVCGIFPTTTFEPLFLVYYLKAKKPYYLSMAAGGAQPNISQQIIRDTYIPIPPREEQERIVAELDCLSGIIEKKREQLKELDTLAQSIFYQMFGDPISNEKGWEVKTIGDVCKLKSGDSSANNTSEGLLPYIKVGDMNMSENIPYITTSSTLVSREENIKGIFPIGTTIFPKRGGAIFTNKKRLTTVEICCDLNTMGVIPLQEVLPLYIFHFFIQIDFGELCNGAAIPQINNIDIAPLKICVPPLALQQEFADKIEAIEKQKELIKESIKETETLFNSRMSYYFN